MQPRRLGRARKPAQRGAHCHGIEAAGTGINGSWRHGGKYIDAVLFTPPLDPLPPDSQLTDSISVSGKPEAGATAIRRTRLALPTLCAVCHGWSARRVCGECLQRFASAVPRCLRCAIQVPEGVTQCGECVVHPPPFERSVTAVDYAYPWDALITRFKFHGALDLAPALAQSLADAVARSPAPHRPLLVPVPLSNARLRERGYNQAWELARRLARLLQCPTDARLLLRVRDTPHQIAFPPEQRAGNVRAAFAVEPRRAAGLRGRTVALVDDVMTTGATAAEAARVLLQAGAAQVHIWSVARTPRPGEP